MVLALIIGYLAIGIGLASLTIAIAKPRLQAIEIWHYAAVIVTLWPIVTLPRKWQDAILLD